MLEVFELASCEAETAFEVTLTYEERKKSRYRCNTRCGKDLGWFLPRGHVLRHGEVLKAVHGELIAVVARNESVSEARTNDPLLLMRAAYHLGNRHVPLQIEAAFLRYQHDHVLDDMLTGLGLQVAHCHAPFQPENGAYHSGAHHHEH
ncbi:MAG: urease accessory protein UreE [Cellvibrionaceae bacterium]|nr:urease accessory protein UreE [Cellvibrionaceae bacterium]